MPGLEPVSGVSGVAVGSRPADSTISIGIWGCVTMIAALPRVMVGAVKMWIAMKSVTIMAPVRMKRFVMG
jgi:hypothetical protein